MSNVVELDVRGLEPPEPMERVLDALASLQAGESVRMLIDREPRPLYRILERGGYAYEVTPGDNCEFTILIRQR